MISSFSISQLNHPLLKREKNQHEEIVNHSEEMVNLGAELINQYYLSSLKPFE